MRALTRFVASVCMVLAFGNLPNPWGRDVPGWLAASSTGGAIRSSNVNSPSYLAIESAPTQITRDSRLERQMSLLASLASSRAGLPSGSSSASQSSSPTRESVAGDPSRGRAPPVEASSLNS